MKRKWWILLLSFLLVTALLTVTALAEGEADPAKTNAEIFGVWTLLPPVLAIALALITKNVLFSLALGAFSGALLLNLTGGNFFASLYHSFFTLTNGVIATVIDPWNAGILLQCFTIMALVAVVTRLGGVKALALWLTKFAKGPRSTQVVTWIMGILVFFDDYANSMIVGPVMRPITDHMKISREKLAFVVDATAAPVAGVALISTWIAAELGCIRAGFDIAGITDLEPYGFFLSTIPFRFYNILMLACVLISALLLRDFGKMYKAEYRARKEGKVLADGAKPMVSLESAAIAPKEDIPHSVWDAVIPLGTLIIGSVAGFYMNGYTAIMASNDLSAKAILAGGFSFAGVQECMAWADASVVLFEVAVFAFLVTAVLAVCKKKLSLQECFDAWVEGFKAVMIAIIILTMAWTMSGFIGELGTKYFLVDLVKDWMPVWLVPSVIFVFGSVISFATGTSYGTMAILMPIAIPLAWALAPGEMNMLVATAGAVLTGAIFGDHCSPISDTTILSSTGAACDHIAHFETQMQYALAVGGISIVCGFIPAGLGLNPWLAMALGVAAVYCVLRFAGKNPEE